MPSETVLLIDDTAANRALFGRWLRLAGVHTEEAALGLEGLERARVLVPDLVVLDVNLPDVNGREICRRIKADPALQGVPVLQTSAIPILNENWAQELEGGADAYLSSPLGAGEFLAVARSLLRLRRAETEARVMRERCELAETLLQESGLSPGLPA
jgi:CheY-like chemotaxis protein